MEGLFDKVFFKLPSRCFSDVHVNWSIFVFTTRTFRKPDGFLSTAALFQFLRLARHDTTTESSRGWSCTLCHNQSGAAGAFDRSLCGFAAAQALRIPCSVHGVLGLMESLWLASNPTPLAVFFMNFYSAHNHICTISHHILRSWMWHDATRSSLVARREGLSRILAVSPTHDWVLSRHLPLHALFCPRLKLQA